MEEIKRDGVRIVSLLEHSKELEKTLFNTLTIRYDFYEKLVKLLDAFNKRNKEKDSNFQDFTLQQFIEKFIDDLYWMCKKDGDL